MVKLLVILVLLFELANTLEVGFYKKSCPSAEAVIRRVVQEEVAKNHKNAAILLRLQFHDCFVESRVSKEIAGHKIAHATLKGLSVVKELVIGLALWLAAGGLWKMHHWNEQRKTRAFYDLLEK